MVRLLRRSLLATGALALLVANLTTSASARPALVSDVGAASYYCDPSGGGPFVCLFDNGQFRGSTPPKRPGECWSPTNTFTEVQNYSYESQRAWHGPSCTGNYTVILPFHTVTVPRAYSLGAHP